MNNLRCQIQSHNGLKIIAVCMDKQYKNRQRLCCHMCLIQLSNTHQNQSVDIDQMNIFLQQESNKQGPQSCSFGQRQIIQHLEKLSSQISILQKIITEKIEKIQQQNLQYQIKKSDDKQQGIENWNQFLEDILQYIEVEKGQIKLITSKEGQLNEMEEREIKIIKQSELSLQFILSQFTQSQIKIDSPTQISLIKPTQIKTEPIQINNVNLGFSGNNDNQPNIQPTQIKKESFIQMNNVNQSLIQNYRNNEKQPIIQPPQVKIESLIQMNSGNQRYNNIQPINPSSIKIKPMNISKLCFDQNRKHVDIALIDQCTIKKTNLQSLAMAYAKEGFDPIKQSYAFSFNIQNLGFNGARSIFVGVGNSEGTNVSSYIFDQRIPMGKGQYMMSNDGYTYHHTDEQFNWKKVGISFNTGEIISIKYNHETQELEYRNSSEEVFKMKITDMKSKLYPCAMLLLPGNQVQLN